MPFGLPPAWNPGFALPDNVLDEGLERRGLVTKQMPRGTYDNSPPDPTGGYVVPQYIRDEGYGQGAVVTKWMPRGTYNGPRVPQWIQRQPTVVRQRSTGRRSNVVTIQRRHFGNPQAVAGLGSLGGLSGEPPLPEPFEQYGARAAQAILSRINQLAPDQRKQQLRKLLDAIDPSLWNRTAEITRRYVGQGLRAAEAFPRGLARALAAGIAAEMITAGQTRAAPQERSLLGLGCYGCNAALGATAASSLMSTISLVPTTAIAVGAVVKPVVLQVGPFQIPYESKSGYAVQFNSPAELARLPEDQKAFIRDMLKKGGGDNGPWRPRNFSTWGEPLTGKPVAGSRELLPWLAALGLPPNAIYAQEMIWGADPHKSGLSADSIADKLVAPIATFERPINLTAAQLATLATFAPATLAAYKAGTIENDWGIFLSSPTPDRKTFYIWYDRIPKSGWWHGLGRFIKHLPASFAHAVEAVGGLVKDALDELGDLACGLATNPNAVAAGAAAGAASGAGAGAGAAGAAIAQHLCGGAKVPLPPPPPPPPNILPYVLIGGGALVAVVLLTKKKKAP